MLSNHQTTILPDWQTSNIYAVPDPHATANPDLTICSLNLVALSATFLTPLQSLELPKIDNIELQICFPPSLDLNL